MIKSIKEKAEEYIGDYYKKLGVDKNLYPIDVEISKADFDAGANYVLEKVESVLPFVVKKGIIYGKIKELIEQLKK